MKPITLTVTLEADALLALLTQAIEKGTARCTHTVADRQTVEPQPAIKPTMTPLEASRHANFGGQTTPEDHGLLIDTRQAYKLLKVSPRTLWRMYNCGEMPKQIRIGRVVRWSYEELRVWVNAGCPKLPERP